MTTGLVYFVTYDHAGWRATLPVIKIGSTTDLRRRLTDLSISSPIKLMPVGTIAAKDPYPLEKSFHRAFTREKLNGEWFNLTAGMLSIIRTHPIIDDRFDELFNLSSSAPDAKDMIITGLRSELKAALGKIEALESQAWRLRGEINGINRPQETRPSHEPRNKFRMGGNKEFWKACRAPR